MKTPLIRKFDDRDAAAVIDVIHTVFDEYGFIWDPEGYNADVYDVPRNYGPPGNSFWVGEFEDRVVGCGGLLTFPTVPGQLGTLVRHDGMFRLAGCDCELMRLYVHPDGRRKGVASGILDAILDDARSRGCTTMEIWSDHQLKDAHRMYDRMGARRIAQRICPPPDEMPEWGMILKL